MTVLTYEVVTKDGVVEVKTLAEARQLAEANGTKYKAKYTPKISH